MGKRDVMSIALKVLGIYFVLYTIPGWMQVLSSGGKEALQGDGLWTPRVASQACIFVISGILILWSDLIARWLCSSSSAPDGGDPVDRRGFQEVAFSVLGLYLITVSLPALGQRIAMRSILHSPHFSEAGDLYWWRSLAGPAIQIVLGLWLFLGSRRIVGWLRRAHGAGHA